MMYKRSLIWKLPFLLSLASILLLTLGNENKQSLTDKLPEETCEQFAEMGQCMTDVDNMKQTCAKTCHKWAQKTLKYQSFELEEDAFYELSAISAATGKHITFDRFEGYITLIIPLAKMCTNNSDVTPQSVFDSIVRLKQLNPYAVEVLVFPYEHPKVNYDESDCDDFEALVKQEDRNILVMEESNLKSNPVFQFFLKALDMDDYVSDTQFYLLVNPNGISGSYEYGKSLLDMHDVLRIAMKDLEHEL